VFFVREARGRAVESTRLVNGAAHGTQFGVTRPKLLRQSSVCAEPVEFCHRVGFSGTPVGRAKSALICASRSRESVPDFSCRS
jgi:hypothetical protein